MDYLAQQLKNIVLGHLLEFQIYYVNTKLRPTNDDIYNLKFRLLILLRDCYLIISLYEKSEDKKKEKLDKIKDIEDFVAKLDLISDSLKHIEDIYDQVLKVFHVYLFSQEPKEA